MSPPPAESNAMEDGKPENGCDQVESRFFEFCKVLDFPYLSCFFLWVKFFFFGFGEINLFFFVCFVL